MAKTMAEQALEVLDAQGQEAFLAWTSEKMDPAPGEALENPRALMVLKDHTAIAPGPEFWYFLWTEQSGPVFRPRPEGTDAPRPKPREQHHGITKEAVRWRTLKLLEQSTTLDEGRYLDWEDWAADPVLSDQEALEAAPGLGSTAKTALAGAMSRETEKGWSNAVLDRAAEETMYNLNRDDREALKERIKAASKERDRT